MDADTKFGFIKTQQENSGENEQPEESNITFESLLEQEIKLSQSAIAQITDKYKSINDLIKSNKPMEQIASEFELDSIDKFRFIRKINKIIEQQTNDIKNIKNKKTVVSSEEQNALDMLFTRFEQISNLMNNIQIAINDLNKCYDNELKSINNYFDNTLSKTVINKKNELLSLTDQLNKHKNQIFQNQLKETELYIIKLKDAKIKCTDFSNTMSMKQTKQMIMKYKKTLCSNKYSLHPITNPMIQFNINNYLMTINDNLFKYINIDDCDQPIINNIHVMHSTAHSMSICWSINDEIFDKLNLKKPPFLEALSKKPKKSKKSDNVLTQLPAKVDKLKPTTQNKKHKDVKTAKKKCKIIFQVSWKQYMRNEHILSEDEKNDNENEGSFITGNHKKQKNKKINVKKVVPTEIDDEKDDSWLFSNEIYDIFNFLIRFLESDCKYYIRIRSKYKKSKEYGLWSDKFIFKTDKLELRWSKCKCNNNPEPKFDLKHKNKIKIRESSISKVAVEYVINCKRYALFTVSFKIDRFYKSSKKKGAVYLGFMTSNIDSHKLNENGYNTIRKLQTEIQPNARRLNKRNIYYKVPLGNMNGFDPVKIDPLAYCIEIKEGKTYIKMFTSNKQGKEIQIESKISIDDLWTFEFRMHKNHCLVYRNNELIMDKKYFKKIPNALCPVISNSRHKNACTVHVIAGKCKRVEQ
eukprot:428852_1